jgi:hypothetical protein
VVTLKGDDQYYERKVVRISDLVPEPGCMLRGFSFDRCDIVGPAVLFPRPNTMINGCNFDGTPDAIIWDWPPEREQVIGVIDLDECSFESCRFTNIGIAAPPPLAEILRASFAA